jgi:hypothetical protein
LRQRKLPAELNDGLNFLTEAPFFGLEGSNFMAFIEVTSIIGGHDAMEEFLTSGLWPLSKKFGFKVETKESPLLKVVAPVSQVDAAIGTEESGAKFEARIMNAANLLVGNYNVAEHKAYQGLRHGLLNHIFELTRVLCQP